MRRYLRPTVQRGLQEAVRRKVGGWERIASAGFAWAQTNAQAIAYKQRMGVMRSDVWLGEALSFAADEMV